MVGAHIPLWHWCPIQPNGQAHWLGLKQVPPFKQGCPHTAVKDIYEAIIWLRDHSCIWMYSIAVSKGWFMLAWLSHILIVVTFNVVCFNLYK